MLTIGQLAAYAGVTVRAVRHYHQVGLLPEPERDRSGYRSYDAQHVADLIKIHTLAAGGVPLARIPELLAAGPEEFAAAVAEIDARLRAEITELQRRRTDLAKLAAGDSLALPEEVVGYLELLRSAGVSEAMLEVERDAWILIAAKWPERMADFMADKRRQFEDPRMVRLYTLIDPAEWTPDDPRLEEAADLLVEMAEEYDSRGDLARQDEEMDDPVTAQLLDAFPVQATEVAERLQELLAERGWSGWTRLERVEG